MGADRLYWSDDPAEPTDTEYDKFDRVADKATERGWPLSWLVRDYRELSADPTIDVGWTRQEQDELDRLSHVEPPEWLDGD